MYENTTYAEIKKLPATEKPVAWKELKSLYKTQKELAEKLGVSPAIVYNMISRYVGSENRVVKLEVVKEPKKARVKKQAEKIEQDINLEAKHAEPVPEIIDVESELFSISIKKTVSGEDAQFFLNGVGSTLLKNQMYLVEVKITEK